MSQRHSLVTRQRRSCTNTTRLPPTPAERAMINAVPRVQLIHYQGRLAGLVVGEEAIIEAGLAGEEQLDVQAMCLFAIELAAGERPGQYSDERAMAFARQARAQRSIAHNLATDGG